jgi:uncharacterized membrane protein SpoIIM required for sporulation
MLQNPLTTSKKIKDLILLIFIIYTVSFIIGYTITHLELPIAEEIKQGLMTTVSTEEPFTIVTAALEEGNLLFAILFTFVFNLLVGAFFSTTLVGCIPVLGFMGILVITFSRGLIIGIGYYEVFRVSMETMVLALGTMILELGAYVFSGAAGLLIGISIFFPGKLNKNRRIEAFKQAWLDSASIYIIVIILLLAGAIWEITGIFLILRS